MLSILGLFAVCFMFCRAAFRAHRSVALWLAIGVMFWLSLGAFFLAFSERILLHINSFEDVIALGGEKLLLEGISTLIVILLAYLLQEKIGVKRKKAVM